MLGVGISPNQVKVNKLGKAYELGERVGTKLGHQIRSKVVEDMIAKLNKGIGTKLGKG